MSMREATMGRIYDTLQVLPEQQLALVLRFVESLKEAVATKVSTRKTAVAPIYKLRIASVDTGIADLAGQHDHYLYGVEKRPG